MNDELQRNYDALRRLHNSAHEAIQMLEKRLHALEAENSRLRANLENADKNILIQKQVVRDNLRMSQETHDNLVAEILGLREIIKQLRGKDGNLD